MPPKKKIKRNISGLRNQPKNPVVPSLSQDLVLNSHREVPEGGTTASGVAKPDYDTSRSSPDEIRLREEGGLDSENSEGKLEKGIGASSKARVQVPGRKSVRTKTMRMPLNTGDDDDWMPPELRWEQAQKKGESFE